MECIHLACKEDQQKDFLKLFFTICKLDSNTEEKIQTQPVKLSLISNDLLNVLKIENGR